MRPRVVVHLEKKRDCRDGVAPKPSEHDCRPEPLVRLAREHLFDRTPHPRWRLARDVPLRGRPSERARAVRMPEPESDGAGQARNDHLSCECAQRLSRRGGHSTFVKIGKTCVENTDWSRKNRTIPLAPPGGASPIVPGRASAPTRRLTTVGWRGQNGGLALIPPTPSDVGASP